MSSASIVGSFIVICGEAPVACFATRAEARAHANALRTTLAEVEFFIAEVIDMIAARGALGYSTVAVERSASLEEERAA